MRRPADILKQMAAEKIFRVEISYKTIIFTVSFLLGIWLLFQIRQIITLIFLSIILVTLFLKPVNWLHARKVPRLVAVLSVYLVFLAFIAFVIAIIVPAVVAQSSDLISKLPQIVASLNSLFIFYKIPVENISEVIAQQVQNITGDIISITSAIFSSIFLIITLFVFTFYLLLEWESVVKLITSPFSGKQEKKIKSLIIKIENGLGHWIRGQLTLSLLIGILTFVGLSILGVPFALPLALIAGILEIVPIVGPIVSAIPAILVGLTIAPVFGLAVGALFLIIQQLENHLLVPIVMSKVVGLQPPVVIITLLIGAKLYGIGGAFLSVPIVVCARVIINELLLEDQKVEDELSEE